MIVKKNAELNNLNTLRIVAEAHELYFPENEHEVKEIFHRIKNEKLDFHVLGAGSNTLLSSRDLPGIVISTLLLNKIENLDENKVRVQAGVKMPRFCAHMTRESLSGTEFMEGIPGTIGGGIVMNAGAHGSSISEILESALILDIETLELKTWSKADLAFQYRHSAINPHKDFLISAIFKLRPDDKVEIRKRVVENNRSRTSKQPIKEWTCGCTFKNPENYSAGQLIESLGLKGLKEGDFWVSEMHANFIENHGEGTSVEFCKLMKKIKEEALKEKSIELKPEVKPMGLFTDEELDLWR
jgi:UDP-N-acetylmuramate dehydrogenase